MYRFAEKIMFFGWIFPGMSVKASTQVDKFENWMNSAWKVSQSILHEHAVMALTAMGVHVCKNLYLFLLNVCVFVWFTCIHRRCGTFAFLPTIFSLINAKLFLLLSETDGLCVCECARWMLYVISDHLNLNKKKKKDIFHHAVVWSASGN